MADTLTDVAQSPWVEEKSTLAPSGNIVAKYPVHTDHDEIK